MNGYLVVEGLPDNAIELDDLTVNGDMLLREVLLLGIKKLN